MFHLQDSDLYLCVAVKLNKPSMIRALVELKASVNATNKVPLRRSTF